MLVEADPAVPKKVSVLTEKQARLHVHQRRMLTGYKYFTYILCKAVATLNGTHQGVCLAPGSADGEAAGSFDHPTGVFAGRGPAWRQVARTVWGWELRSDLGLAVQQQLRTRREKTYTSGAKEHACHRGYAAEQATTHQQQRNYYLR